MVRWLGQGGFCWGEGGRTDHEEGHYVEDTIEGRGISRWAGRYSCSFVCFVVHELGKGARRHLRIETEGALRFEFAGHSREGE